MNRRTFVIAITSVGLAVGAFLVYPSQLVVAPAAVLIVVDPDGAPVTGALVRQVWQDYSVESESHEQDFTTDAVGRVALPARLIRSSRIERAVGVVRNLAATGVHASYGAHAYIFVWGNDLDGTIDMDRPIPERLVLRRKSS